MSRKSFSAAAVGAAFVLSLFTAAPTAMAQEHAFGTTTAAAPGTCNVRVFQPVNAGTNHVSGKGEVTGCRGNVNVDVLVLQDYPNSPDREIARASGRGIQVFRTARGVCNNEPVNEYFAYYTEVRINGQNEAQSSRASGFTVGCR